MQMWRRTHQLRPGKNQMLKWVQTFNQRFIASYKPYLCSKVYQGHTKKLHKNTVIILQLYCRDFMTVLKILWAYSNIYSILFCCWFILVIFFCLCVTSVTRSAHVTISEEVTRFPSSDLFRTGSSQLKKEATLCFFLLSLGHSFIVDTSWNDP